MLITPAQRLRWFRKQKKLSQKTIGNELGISKSAMSRKESGEIEISLEDARVLRKKYGLQEDWLLFGKGATFVRGFEINEPDAEYLNADSWSESAITTRFLVLLDHYKDSRGLNQKELCEQWEIDETTVSNLRAGQRHLPMSMLVAAVRYGNANSNFIVANRGTMYAEAVTESLATDKPTHRAPKGYGVKKRA